MRGLAAGLSTGGYLKEVVLSLDKLDFEMRKAIVQLFTSFLKLNVEGENPLVNYLYDFHVQYIDYVFAKYSMKDFTFCAGTLIRAFLENEAPLAPNPP